METAKTDYLGSLIIGFLAALLSKIMIENLNLQISYPLFALFIFLMCPLGIFVARLLGKRFPGLYQFAKFGETGGLNTFIDLGILNLLILVTGISAGIYYSIFKAISFLVAVVNSYLWNKFWVFKNKEKANEAEVGKFFLVSLVGFLINVGTASIIVAIAPNFLDVDEKLIANFGAVLAFVFTMMFNFFGYKFLVFTHHVRNRNTTTQ